MVGSDYTKEIRAAQVRLLYEQLPSALLATGLNAAILAAVVWNEVSRALLIGWLLMVGMLAAVRYGWRRAYLRSSSATLDSSKWGRHFLYGVAANGVLWGFASFFFFI